MADIHTLANAIIRMEGSDDPKSINQQMVRKFNRWNVGHLTWANQRGAVPVYLGDRNWAGWPTREASYEGLLFQIRLDASRGQTLEQFIEKYAPPKENLTETYIQNVSKWTGIGRKDTLASAIGGQPSTPTSGSPASPGSTGAPQQPVYTGWAGTWTEELAQGLNETLGTGLSHNQALLALGGAALLLLLVATPSRRPAY